MELSSVNRTKPKPLITESCFISVEFEYVNIICFYAVKEGDERREERLYDL